MDPFEFTIASLAVFRLSRMISREDGPAIVRINGAKWVPLLDWMREKAGCKRDEIGEYKDAYPGSVAGLLQCVWCLSVWIGAAVYVSWLAYPAATLIACTPLAISAASSFAFDVEQHL